VHANGVEIYFGPLPDDHKELPFISYHNNASFCTGLVEMTTRTLNGEDVGVAPNVTADKSFWTIGDPATIADLIELRTSHGRAAHRLVKRMTQRIIGTRGNYTLPKDRNWLDGDEAKGAAGNVEVINLAGGGAGTGDFQFAFDDLFQLMRLTIGIDPSNIYSTKTQTLGEAEIQEESAQKRLNMGLEYNEENGEVRMGTLVHKLIQQRYTKPELKRLIGDESKEELASFDEIEKDPVTGKPLYGKKYRRIKSSQKMMATYGKRISLMQDDAGVSSFLAMPETIRTSEIDVAVESGRKAAQSRAIMLNKYDKVLERFIQLLPYTQKDPNTGESLVDIDDFPNFRSITTGIVKALDMDVTRDIGQGGGEQKTQEEIALEEIAEAEANRMPLNAMPEQI
jgi:hypothetical protein